MSNPQDPHGYPPAGPYRAPSSPMPYPAAQPYGAPSGGGPIAPYAGPERAPDNRMVLSVLSTIFGFLPLGVVAIVKSSQVEGLWARGDRAGAVSAADSAKKFAIAAFVVGIALLVAVVVFYVVVFGIIMGSVAAFSSSITTTATSSVPSYMTKSEIDAQIRSASYGDCFRRVASGGELSIFSKVSCSQYAADVKVTSVTTSTSNCGSNWVRSQSDSSRTPTQVVLCLTSV
ncbi:CD225/dispanin family protein [Tsukamurella sp. PLM1]|uniref:CD225/dispanin family protein n=1 Tax=Tsukamurella sp. PLM1 TaxID=2929795 RepID=UPI002070106F|nr:CD225/dispanin family protein [Tsukamurella sp. PLM1]BDH56287.1 hypothetical protein MTP03_12260 [Tsukamurella sp. PLM1]